LGFNISVPDDAGKTASGWLMVNVGGTDYYIPVWV
jgi:hypothetical protein